MRVRVRDCSASLLERESCEIAKESVCQRC